MSGRGHKSSLRSKQEKNGRRTRPDIFPQYCGDMIRIKKFVGTLFDKAADNRYSNTTSAALFDSGPFTPTP